MRDPLAVTRPNQIWAMDITHILMVRGFVHLAAVVDWFSSEAFTGRLTENGINISMDSKRCWRDNAFVERI